MDNWKQVSREEYINYLVSKGQNKDDIQRRLMQEEIKICMECNKRCLLYSIPQEGSNGKEINH